MLKRRLLLSCFTACALALTAGSALAQDYPTRAITIIVPGSPGGAIDTVARLVGDQLSKKWGQAVVVENKAGAANMIGTDFVAKAEPDGYTVLITAAAHAINPSIQKKMAFDTAKDFEPVVLADTVPLMLVVPASLPVNNVQELIAYLKAHPDEVSYASPGTGQIQHMVTEQFKGMTGLEILHVPYKGSTFAHPDLISGRVTMMFDTVTALTPQVQAGTLRPLAVTTATRVPSVPDVPTMAEAGVPGFDASSWGGFLVPTGTPKDIVAKLNEGINAALAVPEVKNKLAAVGIAVVGGTPEEFGRFIQAEMTRWAKVAQDAKISVE
jgi:tripartite-type tricarboxylate transporter receptor subunit TctC